MAYTVEIGLCSWSSSPDAAEQTGWSTTVESKDEASGVPAANAAFDPVPLPSLPPGQLTATDLAPALGNWARSAPIRALAEASGWDWPSAPDTSGLLTGLADLSADWDFRGRDGGKERHLMQTAPAEVNGRVIAEDLIAGAAQALDLVTAAPVPAESFTYLAVLSGQVNACVNRTTLAASLLRDGLTADSTVVLSAHRELTGKEPDQARDRGFGDLFDEADAVISATRQAFGLDEPEQSQESRPRPSQWDDGLWGASARYRWKQAEVVIAPSSEPDRRRANTADQLHYWAELAGLGRNDRVLLVTTQIYVPFQQLAALRLLGLERGCGVYCCGVDATTTTLPLRQFGGREYLQEIRSALLAARELMAAAQQAGG